MLVNNVYSAAKVYSYIKAVHESTKNMRRLFFFFLFPNILVMYQTILCRTVVAKGGIYYFVAKGNFVSF